MRMQTLMFSTAMLAMRGSEGARERAVDRWMNQTPRVYISMAGIAV